MTKSDRWSRILTVAGLVVMLVGTLDPMEGSLLIVGGIALVALVAWRTASRHRGLVLWAFVLVAVGVGALWWLSALGGFGGNSGRSNWWALALVPYPVGWILGLIGALRSVREQFAQTSVNAFAPK